MTGNRKWWMAVATAAVALTWGLDTPAQAKKRKVECKKGYQVSEYKGRRLKTTWSARARNNSGTADQIQLTVNKSGTVETKKSANIESEVGGNWVVFSASVKAQVGIEATRSTTAARGVSYTAQVPPHREVRVRYGVWTRKVRGMIVGDKLAPGTVYVSPLPRGCNREFHGWFTATVATPEVGFVKSKPRRLR
jgi:hypothetical protein